MLPKGVVIRIDGEPDSAAFYCKHEIPQLYAFFQRISRIKSQGKAKSLCGVTGIEGWFDSTSISAVLSDLHAIQSITAPGGNA